MSELKWKLMLFNISISSNYEMQFTTDYRVGFGIA